MRVPPSTRGHAAWDMHTGNCTRMSAMEHVCSASPVVPSLSNHDNDPSHFRQTIREKRMNRLLTAKLWFAIEEIATTKVKKRAAIAYVSADQHISFGNGDTLYCDATDDA